MIILRNTLYSTITHKTTCVITSQLQFPPNCLNLNCNSVYPITCHLDSLIILQQLGWLGVHCSHI